MSQKDKLKRVFTDLGIPFEETIGRDYDTIGLHAHNPDEIRPDDKVVGAAWVSVDFQFVSNIGDFIQVEIDT